ncbi:hypothetical protein M3Y98_00812300 [Aphelenchoides besseyi]|nr:hypothetical protein M3Y98_00812300 [Aphelenchoides besseyi]
MVKFSIASGTYVQEPKINWQIVECPILLDHVVTESPFCCIGRKLFVRDKCVDEYRSRIISLDLDTKKWQRTSFEFSHSIQAMHSDGERALIVSTGDERTKSIHRFVFNIKSNLEAEVREKVYEEQLRAWMTNHESIARNTLAQLNDVQKKLEECLEMCTELKKKSLNEKSMYNRQQFDGARLGNTVYVPTQSTSQSTEENNVSQRIEQSVKTLQNRVECFSGMFHAALEYYEEAE